MAGNEWHQTCSTRCNRKTFRVQRCAPFISGNEASDLKPIPSVSDNKLRRNPMLLKNFKSSLVITVMALSLVILSTTSTLAEEVPSEKEVGAVFPEKQWFENVHMAGFVDVYYSYNFNNPDSRKNGYLYDPTPGGNLLPSNFDFEHNTFS